MVNAICDATAVDGHGMSATGCESSRGLQSWFLGRCGRGVLASEASDGDGAAAGLEWRAGAWAPAYGATRLAHRATVIEDAVSEDGGAAAAGVALVSIGSDARLRLWAAGTPPTSPSSPQPEETGTSAALAAAEVVGSTTVETDRTDGQRRPQGRRRMFKLW